MNDLYKKQFIAATAACVVSLLIAASAAAQSPTTQPGNAGDNPVPARFARDITFYLSFDNSLTADLANGKPEPINVEGTAELPPGLYGRAMLLKLPSKSGSLVVTYALPENVDLTKPGAVAFWLCPHEWVRSKNEGYFWPVNLLGNLHLLLGRMGQWEDPKRLDAVYAWAQVGELKPTFIDGGRSLDWQNGQWHLWVANWTSGSIEFSVDGAAPRRQELAARLRADGTREGQMYVGAQAPENAYLLDELIVLDRPLDKNEIRWIYEQGMQAAARVPATRP